MKIKRRIPVGEFICLTEDLDLKKVRFDSDLGWVGYNDNRNQLDVILKRRPPYDMRWTPFPKREIFLVYAYAEKGTYENRMILLHAPTKNFYMSFEPRESFVRLDEIY